jgi:hypothetical protein
MAIAIKAGPKNTLQHDQSRRGLAAIKENSVADRDDNFGVLQPQLNPRC